MFKLQPFKVSIRIGILKILKKRKAVVSMAPIYQLQCTVVQSLSACYCANMLPVCLDMPATKLHCVHHITHTHTHSCVHICQCIKRVPFWGVRDGLGFCPTCRKVLGHRLLSSAPAADLRHQTIEPLKVNLP